MASLDDLMLTAGVTNAPAWFKDIGLPNWPMPHQMSDIKHLAANIRFGLFSEPGTGKTFPAQVHGILMAALGNKVVYTMPPKLIRQFQGEFRDFFQGIEQRLTIDHLDRPAMQKKKRIAKWDEEGWPDTLLLSYDIFRQLNARSKTVSVGQNQWYTQDGEPYFVTNEDGVKEARDSTLAPFTKDGRAINLKGRAPNPARLKLKRVGYEVFFFDEAHALCNPEAIAFKSVQHMDHMHGDDFALYLMTGTPVPTHLENVYGLIRLINRDAYHNKKQFDRRHVILNQASKFRQVLDYQNEDEIWEHLYKNASRVQKRQVNKLPDPVITSIPVKLSGSHKKLYDKVIRDRFAVLGDQVLAPDNDSALRMLALQLISSPDSFDEEQVTQIAKDNELAKAMDELIDSIDPRQHKVIVFAHFKRTIATLAKRFAQYNPAVMNGATNDGWKEVERFKTDDSCRMFIVNWQSGGAGLNLQVASHVVFYECPTSPKDAKQAIGRVDRNGQQNIVNAYFFRVLATLFDRNYRNLLKNEQQNNKVVRDTHDLLYEQLGVGRKAA